MADSKISDLTAVTSPIDTAEIGVNEGGTSKKMTVAQVLGLASGGGDVSKVGTPVDNEIGVWTGDGTLEGDSNLTWDGSHLLLPLEADAVTPTLAFGDGGEGFYQPSNNFIRIAIAGADAYSIGSAAIQGITAKAGAIRNIASSSTVPSVIPNAQDTTSGVGLATVH